MIVTCISADADDLEERKILEDLKGNMKLKQHLDCREESAINYKNFQNQPQYGAHKNFCSQSSQMHDWQREIHQDSSNDRECLRPVRTIIVQEIEHNPIWRYFIQVDFFIKIKRVK